MPRQSIRVQRVCETCGKTFDVIPSRGHARFCSLACAPHRPKDMVAVPCEICGTVGYYAPAVAAKRRFCSHACRVLWQHSASAKAIDIAFICLNCGQPFTRTAAYVRKQLLRSRAVVYCSAACSAEYQALNRDPDDSERNQKRYRHWRAAVLERDSHTCQHCGSTENLHVHHVKPWRLFRDLRYDLANGLTLCQGCHWSAHKRQLDAAA